ncbi:MAG: histidine kinase, partial [Chloroflexi bacterium]|nr:histidine kinase [Chloroflexota bacterium]
FLLGLEVVSLVLLRPIFGSNAALRLAVVFLILLAAAIPFSLWVFGLIERQLAALAEANVEVTRRNRELAAVNAAIASISGALDLDHVLQRIADAARELVRCRYAALGVADERGRIAQFITSGITPEQRATIGPPPQGHGLRTPR